MNYRSVVAFGRARRIADPVQKVKSLRVISEHLIAGRWEDVRKPSEKELKATTVLEFSMEEVSSKVRSGPPLDDESDYGLRVWAGVFLRLSLISPSVDSLFQPPILKTQAHLVQPSMSKSKPTHPKGQSSVIPRIERLLTEQTSVILQAVDEKLSAQDQKIELRFAALDQHLEERLVAQDIRIVAAVDKRLEKMEERFAKNLDDLTKTLDKFLKRLTDIEQEFTFMKEDLRRVKAVIREKLGVSLD
jgi:hypothetical protein